MHARRSSVRWRLHSMGVKSARIPKESGRQGGAHTFDDDVSTAAHKVMSMERGDARDGRAIRPQSQHAGAGELPRVDRRDRLSFRNAGDKRAIIRRACISSVPSISPVTCRILPTHFLARCQGAAGGVIFTHAMTLQRGAASHIDAPPCHIPPCRGIFFDSASCQP